MSMLQAHHKAVCEIRCFVLFFVGNRSVQKWQWAKWGIVVDYACT